MTTENSGLRVFKNAEFGSVRTIVEGNKILFCASDVAKALGYSNPRDAISRHCRGVVKRDGVCSTTNQHGITSNQKNEMSFIPEGDVYRLIARSKLPAAEKFESWVFDEVLPSIRRNGAYITENTARQLMNNPRMLGEMLLQFADAQDKIVEQQKAIEEMTPKASYYDLVLQSKNAVNISVIAKDYGLSAITLNKMLHEYGIQYKQGSTWLLYQKYADMGLTKSNTVAYTDSNGETCSSIHTKWTQKGHLFIYETLKEHDILPEMEQEGVI